MKFKELFELARAGTPVTVECKAGVERWEGCYPEAGMRMEVVGGEIQEHDCARMAVDYTRFDEFNQRFEQRNYYDAHGNATLTARERGWYNVHEDIYVDPEEDIAAYLDIVADDRKALLDVYAALPEPRPSYVSWLESRVLVSAQDGNAGSLENRFCVHVDSEADGENLLVALAPAGATDTDVKGLVYDANRATANSNLDELSAELVKRDFFVIDKHLTIDV